jgi:hypothetical protein
LLYPPNDHERLVSFVPVATGHTILNRTVVRADSRVIVGEYRGSVKISRCAIEITERMPGGGRLLVERPNQRSLRWREETQ